jgi:hypothetical protein
MPKHVFLLLAVAAILAIQPVQAQQAYYVSPSGSDYYAGTLAAPFQTLGKAQSAMEGSSTIKTTYVETGTYTVGEGWTFTSADNGETWVNYPGEAPVLNGNASANYADGGYILIEGATSLTFEGLTFENMGNSTGAGIYIDSVIGSAVNPSTFVTFRWNVFEQCYLFCIFGIGLQNSIIDSNTFNGQSPGNPSGNTSTAYDAIDLGSYPGAGAESSNNYITRNYFVNIQGGGIAIGDGPTDQPNNNNFMERSIF